MYTSSNAVREKIGTPVEFPIDDLDLTGFLIDKRDTLQKFNYNLYSIINHTGTLEEGHYTAFCRDEGGTDHDWYKYDDSLVKKLRDNESVVSGNAYILFYRLIEEQ